MGTFECPWVWNGRETLTHLLRMLKNFDCLLMQCTYDLWSCSGFILDVSFPSHDELPLAHSTLWQRIFLVIIMGNSISLVHNYHLHQSPIALQGLFLRRYLILGWLVQSSPTIPEACIVTLPLGLGKNSTPLHLFPTLVFRSRRVCPTRWTKQQGCCTCYRAFNAFNPTQHWQLPVCHRTWAGMIFLSMKCIVSQAPKSNQATELPLCCRMQDAPMCLLLGRRYPHNLKLQELGCSQGTFWSSHFLLPLFPSSDHKDQWVVLLARQPRCVAESYPTEGNSEISTSLSSLLFLDF